MTTEQYRSITFIDLDGTLLVNPFEAVVWPAVVGEIARQSANSFEAVYQMIAQENRQRQQDRACSAVRAMDWDDIAQAVASQLGVRLKVTCEALVRANAARHAYVIDDGRTVLNQLRQGRQRGLVVATKGLAKYQQPVLDALGLTPYFDAVLTPDTHQVLKRSAEFYGDWPQKTRLCVMVGDHYADDVETQAKRGFKTVWKRPDLVHEPSYANRDPLDRAKLYAYRSHQTARAAAIIFSLRELPALLEYWETRVA